MSRPAVSQSMWFVLVWLVVEPPWSLLLVAAGGVATLYGFQKVTGRKGRSKLRVERVGEVPGLQGKLAESAGVDRAGSPFIGARPGCSGRGGGWLGKGAG
jgi:hypothetical protein